MSLLGAITATFAAWFTQRVRGPQEDAIDALRTEISALREEVSRLIVQQEQPPPDRAEKEYNGGAGATVGQAESARNVISALTGDTPGHT